MRIIHYIGSLNFGGIERLVYDLVFQQQQRNEIEVSIAVGKMKGEFKNQFKNLNIELIPFTLNSGFDLNPSKIFSICKQLKNFDIIHLHGFHLSVAIAALFSRKKIVYTEHGNFGFGRKVNWSGRLNLWFRKLFFKYSNVIICCNSSFTRKHVNERFYTGERTRIIYNGTFIKDSINHKLLNELKQRFNELYIVGSVGRLATVKRVDILIRVFKQYVDLYPKAILLIVGDGPEKERLQTQVKDLKIEKQVFFLGYQLDVATYLSFFDVSIIASKGEAFGLAAVESLEKHKPVLVFKDGGGVCEVVERFNNNDICKNEAEMVNRLDFYSKNPFVWEDKYQKELEFFSVQRMENEYFNEYKSLL